VWILTQADPPDPSSWALVIGPYGALALALAVIVWLVRQNAELRKDKELCEERWRNLALQMVPALTESTQATKELLEAKGRR